MVYSADRYVNNFESALIDGYTRFDATLAYKQKNYDLRLNLLIDMAPWFGLLLLVLAAPRARQLPAWVPALLLLLPAGYAAEQAIWGTLWTPYNLSVPMAGQTQPLRAAGIRGQVLVDAKTAAFVAQLEKLLAEGGFRSGDPLFAFYDLPGLVYICGGVSPGVGWYFSGRDARNCHALDITSQPLGKACIILNRPMGTDLISCLREHGLVFPENYRLVGTAVSSYGTENKLVQVFAPRQP